MQEIDNSAISTHLGKTSEYKSQYDRSLLVREPRQANRTYLNIQNNDLPFLGNDIWNNYEVTALTDGGVPVVCVAKIVYPCSSEFIVESKSMKLYWNSFNMTKTGKTPADVRANLALVASKDLSDLVGVHVEVNVACNSDIWNSIPADNIVNSWFKHSFKVYAKTLENCVDVSELKLSVYNETPELLVVQDTPGTYFYHSGLLRSRCRQTQQPDSGDVFIYFKGAKAPTKESLLSYIISYREECHFHEEICEALYKRLLDLLQPEELFVRCLYARRGGIDILVERLSHAHLAHKLLNDVNKPHIKTPRQ